MKTINALKTDIARVRRNIINDIINKMVSNNKMEIDCIELDMCDTPIIIDSNEYDDVYTLDRIRCVGDEDKYFLKVDCSCSHNNFSGSIDVVATDELLELYNWFLENEEELL